jgi:DNA helicase-2/ATP-dependent DNA helicase PcrA
MNIENLNESQQLAVKSTEGPLMVLAGAGSGKTRTLVTRIQYLLDEKMVSPYKLLALTFSNKAAREMKERVAQTSECDMGSLQITTFHSFCARLLRAEATHIGLSRNFTIYDDSESLTIIKSLMAKRGVSQKEVAPRAIMGFISELKNIAHYSERKVSYEFDEDIEIVREDEFYSYFQEYENELHKSNAVDFGGLISGVIQLFETYPDVLERYQKRFEYLLVDEYQDTNRAQFTLVYLLSKIRRNICVVGDEDQSIYSWRGADIRNILDFEKVFNDASIIKLEQNYRSSKTIINAASAVISKNEHRKGKEMWTDNNDGELVNVIECKDDRGEADFICKRIIELKSAGTSYQDMAIFYRNNSLSRVLEDELRKNRLPYRVVAGIKFYERKEIKDLLCYLRIVVNGKDSLALSRIINVPARGIGATSLRKIENEAVVNSLSLFEMVEKISDDYAQYKHLRLSGKIQSALAQLVLLIQECKVANEQGADPSFIYEKLLGESGYLDFLRAQKNYESKNRIENLDELSNGIMQYESNTEKSSLAGFLETIMLDTTKEETDDNGEVSLMTIHGSKGLEYEYVFVTGIEETVFPSYRSLEDGDMAIEEERRLFYVAMTRAMKELYLCFARGRMLWGSIKFNGPSRFLDEIPDEFIEWKTFKTGKLRTGIAGTTSADGVDYSDNFSQESDYDTSSSSGDTTFYQEKIQKEKAKYPKGVKINHKLYGEGIVIDSEGMGAEEKVVIKFDDGARKKFMVKYSPLERM